MHAYRQFVEEQMEHRKWVPADLARHSGLTKQTISNIVNDERESLSRLPEAKTVEGIARAFGMSTDKVLAHVALAMGLPVSIERADVSAVSDDELIHEIARRLRAGEQGERDTSPMNQAGVRPADDWPHFDPDERTETEAHLRAREQLARSDYGLIADRGPSEGKRQASEAEKRGEESQDPDDEQ